MCGGFVRGWCPTALAESINPPKQLVLELVQGLRQDNGLDAALTSDLLINRVKDASPESLAVTVKLQIYLGTEIKHLSERACFSTSLRSTCFDHGLISKLLVLPSGPSQM